MTQRRKGGSHTVEYDGEAAEERDVWTGGAHAEKMQTTDHRRREDTERDERSELKEQTD
jgi:hypothetical protein